MFSTLLGGLPPDPRFDGTPDEAVRATIAELEDVGLDVLTDGGVPFSDAEARPVSPPDPATIVAAWEFAASNTERAVKQVLTGPYSAARAADLDPIPWAESLHPVITALAEAGCPLVEIDEPSAQPINDDLAERQRFVDAHRRLLDSPGSIHVSLAMTGGNFDVAGSGTFFDLPYASFAFDLIAGPDNWRLITAAPTDRGIVCGALDPRPTGDETPELLIWAAHYAASSNARGLVRVGLANASSLAGLPRDAALHKLRIVAKAARIAGIESAEELRSMLDPRAVDARSAALGTVAPPRRTGGRSG